ncbi:symplekin isoform X1 [Amborella trichopoda]|uniref:Symplekin C-terminal domain-containing protein n=2 Tax=Amborella trichopoda TaxID=13333 RepID=W1PCB2_AMBTC|nr:symplekin isoform X1 [Amborella trichopoda]ERN05241.1 hypothetical protein AMTR_s00007p00088050 [Amborella trichopoda]|eukprot:XP_006843566.3 symplekin isoform X1 [Amborella trichopoda]
MVGVMASCPRDKALSLFNSAKFSIEIPSKLEPLRQLQEIVVYRDPTLLVEFVPHLMELQSEHFSPIRKFLAEMIGEIGLKHRQFLPEMVPVLISFLKDDTPAVAKQAITTGTNLFRSTLEDVALQALPDSLRESSWTCMLNFKEAVYPVAFQSGSEGVRSLAVRFVEATILLFTPDPNASSRPVPPEGGGKSEGFSISWIQGGLPLLAAADLALEASKNLGMLLDLLRSPSVRGLPYSVIFVLINSLSTIARKRPAFFGRILPVLLVLDPSTVVIKGALVSNVRHALKNAFLACLKCTHPGAAPWRDRLVNALKSLNAGDSSERALGQFDNVPGNLNHQTGDPHAPKDGTLSMHVSDATPIDAGRKRSVAEDAGDLAHGDDISGKRVRHVALVSQESPMQVIQPSPEKSQESSPLNMAQSSTGDGESGPVQQLVAMLGALVAQGESAVNSLEVLITSISSDLLAEVVIYNMRFLPSTRPSPESGEEETLTSCNISFLISNASAEIKQLSGTEHTMSLLSALPQIASLLDMKPLPSSSSADLTEERKPPIPMDLSIPASNTSTTDVAVLPRDAPASSIVPISDEEVNQLAVLETIEVGALQTGIPGLDDVPSVEELKEALDSSLSSSVDLVSGSSAKQESSSDHMSYDKSEALSPRASSGDMSWASSTASAPIVLPSSYLLQKVPPLVVALTDEQKDHIQKLAYVRIIEAYKQIAIAGGLNVRFSLLAYFGGECPLEFDSLGLLQRHILADYLNHEGHELTLHVLYRLYGEAEREQDFVSSSSASSTYEIFLLTVAETLRDSLPAADKSLSRLFGEVPYLPKQALKMLESLCSPGNGKDGKDLQAGDRVTQGLSAVWSLILSRPPIRDLCLNIALQSTVHHMEEVRMKAIRLVANKLYPLSFISQKIENFATEMLRSVVNGNAGGESTNIDRSNLSGGQIDSTEGVPKGGQLLKEAGLATADISSNINDSSSAKTLSSSSISEAQRCMSLFFALCTKKRSLLREIFLNYGSAPDAVKQAVHRHIPILIRTIGSSPELLSILSDPPTGSESLLMQVLHTLTDGTIPSPDLIYTVKRLYDSKLKDVGILIPIVSSLPKDELLSLFPQLVDLPLEKFKAALVRILKGSPNMGPVLTPAEVLIAIHEIDPERDGIPLKKVTDACSACFEQRVVFTQQVLAKVLNQLVEQIPLPLLFMRTVIQTIGSFPALVDFIMDILSRLVSKQIWKYPKLWVGFLKCAFQTKSYNVLLQLPAAQLENALTRTPALRQPLVAHANQPNIRSSLPRSTLVVLGLAQDTQSSSQAQPSLSSADAGTSNTQALTDTTKEAKTVG